MQQESTPGAEKEPIFCEPHLSTLTQSTAFLRCSTRAETVNYKANPARDMRCFPEKETASLSTSSQFIYLKLVGIFFLRILSLRDSLNLKFKPKPQLGHLFLILM